MACKTGLMGMLLSACLLAAAPAAHAETLTYAYDARGQMISVATSGGATVTYAYDANGNRTEKAVTGGTGGSNVAPAANDDPKTIEVYVNNTFPTLSFNPRANDTDANGDTLTITAVSQPWNGTVTFTATSVTFTYAGRVSTDGVPDAYDTAEFTYTISDGNGGTATGNIVIDIVAY